MTAKKTVSWLKCYDSPSKIPRREQLRYLLVRQHRREQDCERSEGGGEVPEVVVVEEVEEDTVAAHAERGRRRDGRRVVLCL